MNITAGGHGNNTGLKRIGNFCEYFRLRHLFLGYCFTFLISLVKVKTYWFLYITLCYYSVYYSMYDTPKQRFEKFIRNPN